MNSIGVWAPVMKFCLNKGLSAAVVGLNKWVSVALSKPISGALSPAIKRAREPRTTTALLPFGTYTLRQSVSIRSLLWQGILRPRLIKVEKSSAHTHLHHYLLHNTSLTLTKFRLLPLRNKVSFRREDVSRRANDDCRSQSIAYGRGKWDGSSAIEWSAEICATYDKIRQRFCTIKDAHCWSKLFSFLNFITRKCYLYIALLEYIK